MSINDAGVTAHLLAEKMNLERETNGIDGIGSVHPSGDQLEFVTKTKSSPKEKSPGI